MIGTHAMERTWHILQILGEYEFGEVRAQLASNVYYRVPVGEKGTFRIVLMSKLERFTRPAKSALVVQLSEQRTV
jgi:hypothetical protein